MGPSELRRLARSAELRDAIARALEAHGERPPASPRVNYVRFKPGTGALLGFTDGEGEGARPVGYAKVFTEGDAAECAAKYAPRAKGEGWVAELPGLDVAFFRFPLDRSVGGLANIVDPARLKHVLHGCVPGLSPDGERVRARRSDVTLLKWKPERRGIVRADLATRIGADGAKGRRRLVVQANADGSAAVVADAMERVRARAAGEFRVPRALGVDAPRRVLVQEWVPGEPWGVRLAGAGSEEAARAAARVLRVVRATEPPAGLARSGPGPAADAAARVLEDLAGFAPADLRGRALHLATAVRGRARRVRPRPPVLLHGDFHYHQLLLDPLGAVSLLDLDEVRTGDAREDAGNLLAHLVLVEVDGRLGPSAAERLRAAFLDELARGDALADDLSFFVAIHLAKLALVPFRNLREDWEERSAALLERAGALLADAGVTS